MYQILETNFKTNNNLPRSVQENLEVNFMMSQLLYMRYQIPSFIDRELLYTSFAGCAKAYDDSD